MLFYGSWEPGASTGMHELAVGTLMDGHYYEVRVFAVDALVSTTDTTYIVGISPAYSEVYTYE